MSIYRHDFTHRPMSEARRQHLHGRIEPLVEYPSFIREAAVVIPAIVVGMGIAWAVAVVVQ